MTMQTISLTEVVLAICLGFSASFIIVLIVRQLRNFIERNNKSHQNRRIQKETSTSSLISVNDNASPSSILHPVGFFPKRILIAYATQKGTARTLATRLYNAILACHFKNVIIAQPTVLDVSQVNVDDLATSWDLVIFIVSTYTGGAPPETSGNFAVSLKDLSEDFRVPRDYFTPISEIAKRKKILDMRSKESREQGDYVKNGNDNCCMRDEKKKKKDNDDNCAVSSGRKASCGCGDAESSVSPTCCSCYQHKEIHSNHDGSDWLHQEVIKNGLESHIPLLSTSFSPSSSRHPPFFAIFGLGDIVYGEHFNTFAKDLDNWVKSLGGRTVTPSVFSSEVRLQMLFALFSKAVLKWMDKKWVRKYEKNKYGSATRGVEEHEGAVMAWDDGGDVASMLASDSVCGTEGEDQKDCGSDSETSQTVEEGADDHDEDEDDNGKNGGIYEDIEDAIEGPPKKKQMLYPRLQQNLSKQGYQLIGTHSAVKLCRWNKSMLRGRGGCYKHTFYNISSFQCMELTPSLACANKCVFCWRHHTNPVGKSFVWEMDPPEFLVDTAIQLHRAMIKQMKGVPGVQPDRLAEAMNIKHCALSLVGEPIMYPEINKFCALLHENHISTFMVTNAQFPDRIKDLAPVTQLYISIDAATKTELKKIDRPIFEDFWERALQSIDEIALKRQRTVFRLTLVHDYNMQHIGDYAAMVKKGLPDFIEVKGVTYAGESNASSLTMKNVPFHEEVVQFCVDLSKEIGCDGEYEIACEHEHSCCVLIARKTFKINGVWHTWIDYGKFFDLYESGSTDFASLDYAAPTPSWAVFNSEERGFDPIERRHRRNNNKLEIVTGGK